MRQYLFFWPAILVLFMGFTSTGKAERSSSSKTDAAESTQDADSSSVEADIATPSILTRAWQSGFVVFMVLLCLIFMSIMSWAIGITKMIYLRQVESTSGSFVKTFWDSKSLNELNNKLNDYPYSPVKEVFRTGYAELVRSSQMREGAGSTNALVINAAIGNLTRSLGKAKYMEKKRMERFLTILAISASASPFIGLFGTVWGIMSAFEGIARSGSASLAAVAPGISEALIATAFGLAAAIPAVIAYNLAGARIRGLLTTIDGFSADFLNIVERYLVTDKGGKGTSPSNNPATAGNMAP